MLYHWTAVPKVQTQSGKYIDAMENLQPFKRHQGVDPERHPLWILHRLWNDDKHRTPRVMMGVADSAHIAIEDGEAFAVFNSGPLELGTVVARVWLLSDPEPTLIPEFSFEIAFDIGGLASGLPVHDFLSNVHHLVGDIVNIFRPFFTGDQHGMEICL